MDKEVQGKERRYKSLIAMKDTIIEACKNFKVIPRAEYIGETDDFLVFVSCIYRLKKESRISFVHKETGRVINHVGIGDYFQHVDNQQVRKFVSTSLMEAVKDGLTTNTADSPIGMKENYYATGDMKNFLTAYFVVMKERSIKIEWEDDKGHKQKVGIEVEPLYIPLVTNHGCENVTKRRYHTISFKCKYTEFVGQSSEHGRS